MLSCLYNFEAEMSFVEHDDLVLISSFIHHVTKREKCVSAGQYCFSPGGVALMTYH